VATAPLQTWSLVLAVVVVGIALRLAEYLHNDSLWGDEAMLALSIASRPFHDLLPPLGYGQVAPVPFLWAERLLVVLFGTNEWALRALPLVAGSALCVAVAVVAWRMLRPEEALVSVVIVAFSQTLVRYSAEVKPYGLDAVIAVILVGVAAAVLGRMSHRSWAVLAIAGAIGILLSLTSVFVLSGVILALAMQAWRDQRTDLLVRTGVLALSWGILFALIYQQLYSGAAAASYMRSFWEGSFLRPGSAHLLARTEKALGEVLWALDPGAALLGLGILTGVLVMLGIFSLWRRGHPAFVLLLLIPGVAPFTASAVGLYPIATRLMVFAVPLLACLVAVGIMTAGRATHRLVPPVPARWVAALLVFPTVATACTWAVLHGRDQQMRPLVQHLTQRWQPKDAVYVYHRIVPAWLFYSTDWAEPRMDQLAWAIEISGPGGLGHENGPSRGPRMQGEGDTLTYDLRGHRILLGTSTGVQGRPMFGYDPAQPDPGWAESESDRMRREGSPRIWLVLGSTKHGGVDLAKPLLEAVRRSGGTITYRYSLEDGALYLVTFGPAG
jgi:hypothetical protein